MNGKKAITSLQITIGCLAYFILMFIFFMFLPAETGVSAASSGINETLIQFTQNTTAENSPSASNVPSTLARLFTFDIAGISVWLRLILVVGPLILLGLGIFGLIRGI